MATDSFNLGIPLPADSTKISEFPAVTRRGLERVAEVLAGGLTEGAATAVDTLAHAAVRTEIANADLATFVDAAPVDDAAGGFLDTDGRVTWLTHSAAGGPTEYARRALGIYEQAALTAAGGFLDSAGRATWLTHTADGGPTEYALKRLLAAMPATSPEVPAAASVPSNRHAMLENELRLNNGGTIRTNGAAPVVLICDHGVNNFKNILLPLLTARGLPSVLALNGNLHKPGHRVEWESANVPWTEINAWPSVEIANHGAEHPLGEVTEAQLEAEIIGSLADLKKNLPAKKILAWVQPAVEYPGFHDGATTANWAGTTAGRLIYEHHAVATGTMKSPTHPLYPRDGNPLQGVAGVWIDGAGGTTAAMEQVRAAAAAGKGLIIRHHPKAIDTAGSVTTAELAALLDFLKAEQTAGRIKVMNFSQWSVADTGK